MNGSRNIKIRERWNILTYREKFYHLHIEIVCNCYQYNNINKRGRRIVTPGAAAIVHHLLLVQKFHVRDTALYCWIPETLFSNSAHFERV